MNAWLTQIILDSRSREVRQELADAVAMHRRVMKLVPHRYPEHARREAGVLYRVDFDRRDIRLLVQTKLQPDTSRIPPEIGTAQTKELTPLLRALRRGATVRYRLTANASKRLAVVSEEDRSGEERRCGPVVPLRGAAAEQWWLRRAPRCGLSLRTVDMRPMPNLCGRRGEQNVTHAATRFDGIAVVEDPDALREAVLSGIGRGKSYGCGLLSLALVVA